MPILPDLPKAEAAIIEHTNAFRAANGLATVKPDSVLDRAARGYARFLSTTTLFTHEADGRRPVDRIKAAGYEPCSTAENLARLGHSNGFETKELARLMVEGWQNSPGHRRNMLLPLVTETAVAIAKVRIGSEPETYVAVQLFGRPGSLQYTLRIENDTGRTVSYEIGGETRRLEPRVRVTHTLCEPRQLAIETSPGGILSKAVTSRYETRAGQVFRLTATTAGGIAIDVSQSR